MTMRNLSPQDIAAQLRAESIVLIDVREPDEYAAERIHGTLLFPLSTFDPHALPNTGGKPVVFQCGSGVRSAKAIAKCQAAGLPHDSHMEGGIQAWKAARLPTIKIDPATGQLREG
jgi:rhodanese-related sulfurtransferase